MTQHKNNGIEEITKLLMTSGFEKAVPQVMEIVLNTAMKTERDAFLKAAPYERTENRIDMANGYKPKQIKTRYGELSVQIPQTRHTDFYPSCLEKGLRSERALNCSLAEMYIEGVSTRRVTKILGLLNKNI